MSYDLLKAVQSNAWLYKTQCNVFLNVYKALYSLEAAGGPCSVHP